MKTKIALDANEMQDVIDAVMNTADAYDYDIDDDDLMSELMDIVDAALDAIGVELVPDEEDEDADADYDYDDDYEEEEEEDDDEDDPIDSLIYPTDDGHWAINHKDALLMLQICFERAHKVLSDVLPDETISEIAQRVFTQIMEDWGADRVDVTDMYKENGQ